MPLEEFAIAFPLPVLWADQDLFGHVNNVTFLRWFESARVRYWDDTGMRDVMAPSDCGPILASVHCNYRRQLRYPDTIWVGGRIRRLGRTSLTMEHQVFSESQHAIVADGESVVVIFNYKQQCAAVISLELRATVEKAEGHAFDH